MEEYLNEMTKTQMELAVQFLKHRLRTDYTTFIGHTTEYNQIKELIWRTSEHGVSNSALVIGPPGCGKTTMLSSILSHLLANHNFRSNALIVNLNGYVHTDDAVALKSITRQMELETAVDGKVFTTFADNLAFLLDCLKTGDRATSKRVIYILEEFDLFCAHANQTLIYNLFDVAQSAQAPICVIGLTRRIDVIEMLEKRVKSRFSHRQIFLFNESNADDELANICVELLKLPKFETVIDAEYIERKKHGQTSTLPLLRADIDLTEYKNHFKRDFIAKWNKEVDKMASNKTFTAAVEHLHDQSASMTVLKNIVFRIVASIDGLHDQRSTINATKLAHSMQRAIEHRYTPSDSKIELMRDLSILEFSLMIAMKHHSDIYDRDPFNFEMILTRLHKFQNCGDYTIENYDRDVVLKAFDVLKYLGLIETVGNASKDLKEYQMHKLCVQNQQIDKAVNLYKNLPTHISQWAKISQI